MKSSAKQKLLNNVSESLSFGNNMLQFVVTTPANFSEVITVIGNDDIHKKLKYIDSTYDEELIHRYSDEVKITNYQFSKTEFNNVEEMLSIRN